MSRARRQAGGYRTSRLGLTLGWAPGEWGQPLPEAGMRMDPKGPGVTLDGEAPGTPQQSSQAPLGSGGL